MDVNQSGADVQLARALLHAIRDPLLVLDENLLVIGASRSFCRMFNGGHQVTAREPFQLLGGRQWDIPELTRLLRATVQEHTSFDDFEVEQQTTEVGRRSMLLNAREMSNHLDAKAFIVVSMEDVTARKTVERQLAGILAEKEVLLQELQHRVANSLQIIASILLMKARGVNSADTRQHLQDAHQRIMAVASAQAHLRVAGQGESIPMGPYLSRLCDALAMSMFSEHRPVKFKVEADHSAASSTEAVSLGLIVTELVINALKHAFADSMRGMIVVSYKIDKTGWRLTVSDNGVGNVEEQSTPEAGLGTSIIEALARKLDARVEISITAPHGRTVSIVHRDVSASATGCDACGKPD